MKNKKIYRRHFLHGTGALIALPALESVGVHRFASAENAAPSAAAADAPVKRLVTIGTYLGFHTPSWFPKQTGTDYQMSEVLAPLDREEFVRQVEYYNDLYGEEEEP